MNLREAMYKRRKRCEKFDKKPLPDSLVQELIKEAAWSLGAWKMRPWHLIVVKDKAQRQALRDACFGQAVIEDAPVVIAAGGDTHDCDRMARNIMEKLESGVLWRGNEAMYARVARKLDLDPNYRRALVVQAAYVAVEHLSLLAASRGFATCNINWFEETEARKVLDLPDYVKLATILAIGYPDLAETQTEDDEVWNYDDLAYLDRFGKPYTM